MAVQTPFMLSHVSKLPTSSSCRMNEVWNRRAENCFDCLLQEYWKKLNTVQKELSGHTNKSPSPPPIKSEKKVAGKSKGKRARKEKSQIRKEI